MALLGVAGLFCGAINLRAQAKVEDLAKVPADAEQFTILSTGAHHGTSAIWTASDGTRWARESMNLRGQMFEQDQSVKLGKDGMPTVYTVRGFTPQGDAGETFSVSEGVAKWKSQVDAGSHAYQAPAFYVALGGPSVGCGPVSRSAPGRSRQDAGVVAERQGPCGETGGRDGDGWEDDAGGDRVGSLGVGAFAGSGLDDGEGQVFRVNGWAWLAAGGL